MSQAIIEMAKQIAKLQAENEEIKARLQKTKKVKRPSKQERERSSARMWAERQYEKLWKKALQREDIRERLEEVRQERPDFTLENDCMEKYAG